MKPSAVFSQTDTSMPPVSQDASDYFQQFDTLSKIKMILCVLSAISIVIDLFALGFFVAFVIKIIGGDYSIAGIPVVTQLFALFFVPLLLFVAVEVVILTRQNRKLRKIDLPEAKKLLKTSHIMLFVSELPILALIALFIVAGISMA